MYETLFILYVGKKTDWIKWKGIFWLEVIQNIFSNFIVYFPRCVWFFRKNMFFGRVYDLNSYDVVKTIEGYGNADSGTPVVEITITNCEQLR